MSVTPTGACGLALSKLAGHISESATFQSFTSTASAAAALARIKWPWADFNSLTRPFAVIADKDFDGVRVAGGASTLTLPQGTLAVLFVKSDDGNYSEQDNWVLMDNFVQGVVNDLRNVSGVSDNLNMTDFSVFHPIEVTHPREVAKAANTTANPKVWRCGILVSWGAL